MVYTVTQLVTDAFHTSGIVGEEFETVSGEQQNKGFRLLNSLLAKKTADKSGIPYFLEYNSYFVIGQEQYVITPGSAFDGDNNGPQAAFRALMVAGVPIYPDPYCPEGTVYFLNTNYLSLYIHEQGSFVFTGFESTLPNWQIGYVGAVIMIAELVSVKPKSMSKVTGYNYLSL